MASKVAGLLVPGDVVVLSGEVGAGKSTFVRAAAKALSVQERVTSPTYQLARGYDGATTSGPVRINHLDLYRIEGVEERDVLEFDDYLDERAITFVEWAEPILDFLENPTHIHLSHMTPTNRNIEISGPVAGRLDEC